MPKLSKQFHLEITVEQFLNGCSYIELQELDLLLGGYLKKAEHEAQREAYRQRIDPEDISAESESKELDFGEDF